MTVAVVADGAGSAKCSTDGSRIAVETMRDWLIGRADADFEVNRWAETFVAGLGVVRERLQSMAADSQLELRDYATTLLTWVQSPHGILLGQVGDGAIVIFSEHSGYSLGLPIPRGEFVNETHFVTDPADILHDRLVTRSIPTDVAVTFAALFTDGLSPIALNLATVSPHAGFFEPIRRRGRDPALRDALAGELEDLYASEKVKQRTDDDLCSLFGFLLDR